MDKKLDPTDEALLELAESSIHACLRAYAAERPNEEGIVMTRTVAVWAKDKGLISDNVCYILTDVMADKPVNLGTYRLSLSDQVKIARGA